MKNRMVLACIREPKMTIGRMKKRMLEELIALIKTLSERFAVVNIISSLICGIKRFYTLNFVFR